MHKTEFLQASIFMLKEYHGHQVQVILIMMDLIIRLIQKWVLKEFIIQSWLHLEREFLFNEEYSKRQFYNTDLYPIVYKSKYIGILLNVHLNFSRKRIRFSLRLIMSLSFQLSHKEYLMVHRELKLKSWNWNLQLIIDG